MGVRIGKLSVSVFAGSLLEGGQPAVVRGGLPRGGRPLVMGAGWFAIGPSQCDLYECLVLVRID